MEVIVLILSALAILATIVSPSLQKTIRLALAPIEELIIPKRIRKRHNWRSSFDELFPAKIVRVGLLSYPPYTEYKITEGKIEEAQGLFPSIVQRIFKASGIFVSYQPVLFPNLQNDLDSGSIDFVAGIFETYHRRSMGLFTKPIHLIGTSALANFKEPEIMHVRDLFADDIEIGVIQGEIGWEFIQQYLIRVKGAAKIREFVSVENRSLFEFLSIPNTKRVIIIDSLTCKLLFDQYSKDNTEIQLSFYKRPLYYGLQTFMCGPKRPELQSFLQEALDDVLQESEIVSMGASIARDLTDVVFSLNQQKVQNTITQTANGFPPSPRLDRGE